MFHTEKLALEEILQEIEALAITPQGKSAIRGLRPATDCLWIAHSQRLITQMQAIIQSSGAIPMNPLTSFNKAFDDLVRQMVLTAGQIYAIGSFLEDVDRLKRFMQTKADVAPEVSAYALSLDSLPSLLERIRQSVHGDTVLDEASNTLSKIRRQIRLTEDKIKEKLQSILQQAGNEALLTDAHIALRDGRYVIPVKSAAKSRIAGRALDASKSGSTTFVEPEAVKRLSDTLAALRLDEDNECYRILAELTNAIGDVQDRLSRNREGLITYDQLSAKAKYSQRIGGSAILVDYDGPLKLIEARHPQLGASAVPLNLTLENKSIVITGPNTGGKTVVLKTVGLLTLMAMCGLLVPAHPDSRARIFDHVLADIGDGQSIAQNLSTFSSHIVNIQGIVSTATSGSLVLLDEVGSGTEPNEGAGIAIAILEALHSKGACILATTHFSQLKVFAQETPGFVNGSMLFDTESLNPLYRLAVGEAGKSHALLIALKLGLQSELLDRAHRLTYGQPFDRTAYLELLAQQQEHLSQLAPPIAAVPAASTVKDNALKDSMPRSSQPASPFQVGDSVYLPALKSSGVIITAANRKGDHAVEVKGKRLIINHKRMKPYIDQKDLYPDNYNLDIVTKSWKQRKAEKDLSKGKKVVLEHNI